MYENECVLDKFKVAVSPDSNSILTGSYNSWFHMMDANSGNNYQFELSYKKQTVMKQIHANKMTSLPKIYYQRKTMACDFHPTKNLAAVSCWNSFFLYGIWKITIWLILFILKLNWLNLSIFYFNQSLSFSVNEVKSFEISIDLIDIALKIKVLMILHSILIVWKFSGEINFQLSFLITPFGKVPFSLTLDMVFIFLFFLLTIF